jgi:hypothetical protein
VRYRFKGIVRTTGQHVEGHAQGNTPDEAYNALAEHGIVTESLVPDPEPLNLASTPQPYASAIDSALDTAAAQVPFDALADRFKGKNVWVLDRDKIRSRVSQVVDQALRQAMEAHPHVGMGAVDVREQVAQAINGLFRDNRNLTSQVSNSSMQLENQIQRIESFVRRAESVLAQMTVAISRIGTGGGGGGGGGRRSYQAGSNMQSEQNSVLLEIFKENLRLRGIEIDQGASAEGAPEEGAPADGAPAGEAAAAPEPTAEAPQSDNSTQPTPTDQGERP